MARKEKEMQLQELTDKMKSNNGVVLTEYQGLTVAEISELRAKLRPLKCEYKVVKNTLSKLALKDTGLEAFAEQFVGPTAIAIENGDPVSVAKVLIDFSKAHAKLKLKASLLGTKMLSETDLRALAALPSREVLIAKMLGSMQSPLYGLVNVLQGSIRNIVYVLEAVRKQKEAIK
jgi:large subunit ribosomal protein L10